MARKAQPAGIAAKAKVRASTTPKRMLRAAAAAVSAADGKGRAPQKDFVAVPPADSETAEQYIARIRAAQHGIHTGSIYKPLPPSAEIIDEFGQSAFSPDYYELVFNYCLLGASNEEVAMFLGVPPQTVVTWQRVDELFKSAVNAGRMQADARVVNSLYRRALGYSHNAVKIFYDAKSGHVEEVDYVQHYPPDTTAAIFWLKNRQPEKWKDKSVNEHSGIDGKPIEVENVRTALAERLTRIAEANRAGRSDKVGDGGGAERDQSPDDGAGED